MSSFNSTNITLFVIALFIVYFAILMYFYFFQRQFIYFPLTTTTIDPTYKKEKMQTITLHTQDKVTLKAIYQPAEAGQPTCVVFLGNANELGTLTPTLATLSQQGYGILHVGYRGYSNNPGKPTELGLYQDARAGMAYIQQHNIPLKNIILYGESLGTGVAVQMATEYSVRAVILQAPFSSLVSVAQKHYPYIPSHWLLVDRYQSLDKIQNIHVPLFIYHGSNDNTVPYAEGKRLFDAANEPKKMKTFAGLHHTDLPDVSQDITAFLHAHT